ncbi:TasA family protein [Enterococcus sp. AZ072]|uniref:TasA family protein n=1 Tax=unclassified Enterococcus TaxID=2608891 RepID=UPI003D2D09B5
MRNRKKKLQLIYVAFTIALVLLLIGGGYFVYAAMTAQDQKANDFQVGQIETKLLEDFTGITEIETGQTVKKEVLIENTGTIKQFIRVMVLPEVRAPIAGDTNKQVLPLVIGKDLVLENMATTDWKDGGDGYYYYIKDAVEPKKKTTKLFESIKLSDSLSKQYDATAFSIYLKVETVNCAEFAYRDAWWQGNTPTDQPLKAIDDVLKMKVENKT